MKKVKLSTVLDNKKFKFNKRGATWFKINESGKNIVCSTNTGVTRTFLGTKTVFEV